MKMPGTFNRVSQTGAYGYVAILLLAFSFFLIIPALFLIIFGFIPPTVSGVGVAGIVIFSIGITLLGCGIFHFCKVASSASSMSTGVYAGPVISGSRAPPMSGSYPVGTVGGYYPQTGHTTYPMQPPQPQQPQPQSVMGGHTSYPVTTITAQQPYAPSAPAMGGTYPPAHNPTFSYPPTTSGGMGVVSNSAAPPPSYSSVMAKQE